MKDEEAFGPEEDLEEEDAARSFIAEVGEFSLDEELKDLLVAAPPPS